MSAAHRFSVTDHVHMARALQLAAHGLYTTSPNPRVGCVIVKDDHVVGEGWHQRTGTPHAEIHALKTAGDAARGATVYVTLEPCSHHGKTPPCAEALIQAGVARVVAAMSDPNPLVAGGGIDMLTLAGIQVEVGLMENEARALNPGFVSRMTRQRPWVRLKTASTLDGKTALDNGQSQWITGEAARADVQKLRARACAILTGSGTVLADNPRMNVRDVDIGRQPLRVIVDSALRTPVKAAILPALIACRARPVHAAAAHHAGRRCAVSPG
jgi:diaminohydroxyphosphoribosylaminopyrimidine deaminase/5-amino-6-(5-phosphoribosylamino)uracil reductase